MKIMVTGTGHAVPKAGYTALPAVLNDSSWLGGYKDEGRLYFEHIQETVRAAAARPGAAVVFSGGQTREIAGRRSEAQGYWEVARDNDWFGHPTIGEQALREEFARDSLENLLFSLVLFYQTHGAWPERIVVVGWEFKRERYDLHRQAIKWPSDRFEYVGANNPQGKAMEMAEAGEKRKLNAVRSDAFLAGPEWAGQREFRDPFQRGNPYRGVHPSLDALFDIMATHALRAKMPW